MVEWRLLAVPWGCLLFVIVLFPDHTHFLFLKKKIRVNGWKDGRTDKAKAICPFNFFQSWGHKKIHKRNTALERSLRKLMEGLN